MTRSQPLIMNRTAFMSGAVAGAIAVALLTTTRGQRITEQIKRKIDEAFDTKPDQNSDPSYDVGEVEVQQISIP